MQGVVVPYVQNQIRMLKNRDFFLKDKNRFEHITELL